MLKTPAGLLDTINWMFLALGELIIVVYLFIVPLNEREELPPWLTWLTVASLGVTGLVWYWGYRRGSYGGWQSVVGFAPVFLLSLTADLTDAGTDVLFARTLLQSTTGSLRRKLLQALFGLLVVAAGLLLSTEPLNRVVARLLVSTVVVLLITVFIHAFLANLTRYGHALERERVLAKVSGQLTGRVGQQRISEVVVEGVAGLVEDDVSAAVAVGPRERLQVTATSDDLKPVVGVMLRLDDGGVRLAQPSQPQARHPIGLLDPERPTVGVFRITARDELYGLLVADLPEEVEPDVRVTLDSLCSSAGLALANTVLTEELTKLAFHDPLTRLANRSLLSEQIDTALARAVRVDTAVALLLVDLDGFKRINDQFGHLTGDETLVIVAARLLDQVREGDVVARVGGDEFAVLLTDLHDPSEATAVARRILRALDGPITVGDNELPVGASIGIVVWPGADAAPGARGSRDRRPLPLLDDLLRDADAVMYVAKARGSGYEIFPEGPLGYRPERPAEPGPRAPS